MDTLYKKNFMFIGRIGFEKNAIITSKFQSCTIVLINNFEILQVSIAFFSNTVRPRNIKFLCILTLMDTLYKKKFHVHRSHSFREKCIENLQIQRCTILLINNFEILQDMIAFFSNTMRPRNMKFFCILTLMDTL